MQPKRNLSYHEVDLKMGSGQIELDPQDRCTTLLHEMLHCHCRMFYGDKDPRHDNLDDWGHYLKRCCSKGKKLGLALTTICGNIKNLIPPPNDC